ncbi:MAG: cytochrome-c peroxidase [Candidatus Rariloculaceae bacterium]
MKNPGHISRNTDTGDRTGLTLALLSLSATLLAGCGSNGGDGDGAPVNGVPDPVPAPEPPAPEPPEAIDVELRSLITQHELTGAPDAGRNLPSIDDPVPQLGKLLFFSKSLGGGFDTACVSCHHPLLGGSDELSLSVGTGAVEPDVLGTDRSRADGLPNVPRNAPTIFNSGLHDNGMFWDSRVESIGREYLFNGRGSGIRTPDTSLFATDLSLAVGSSLPAAQARFPVTSSEEMKATVFEEGSDGETIRAHLAARIGNYGVGAGELATNGWLAEFQNAFASALPAEDLITFSNIAFAIGEYERSMNFTNSPWRAYVEGDNAAISNAAKRGAILFLTSPDADGFGCHQCHTGDVFSDGDHHTIGFPSFGPGRGDGNNDDFGRAHETGLNYDRYRFRTPSLLNVEVTGPYGHAGAYETLDDVVRHYDNQDGRADNFFDNGGWCQLEQFEGVEDCEDLYPDAQANTDLALQKLRRERNNLPQDQQVPQINIDGGERRDVVDFLETLTDPCVLDPVCLAPWIADPESDGPDGMQLNALDAEGAPL